MSIEQKLQQVAATAFEGVPFIFDDIYGLIERLNTTEMPCVMCTLPRDGRMTWRNGKVYDRENIMVGFFDVVEHDADGWDNAEVFNRMKDMARRYVDALNASGLFEHIDTVGYDVYCERFTNIVTGLFLQLDINDVGVC